MVFYPGSWSVQVDWLLRGESRKLGSACFTKTRESKSGMRALPLGIAGTPCLWVNHHQMMWRQEPWPTELPTGTLKGVGVPSSSEVIRFCFISPFDHCDHVKWLTWKCSLETQCDGVSVIPVCNYIVSWFMIHYGIMMWLSVITVMCVCVYVCVSYKRNVVLPISQIQGAPMPTVWPSCLSLLFHIISNSGPGEIEHCMGQVAPSPAPQQPPQACRGTVCNWPKLKEKVFH